MCDSVFPAPRIRRVWCWLWYGHEWVRENAGATNQMCFRCGKKGGATMSDSVSPDERSRIRNAARDMADAVSPEPPRPEIAFAAALGRRKPHALRPYHLTNIEQPWLSACGLSLDAMTVKPLGVGDWTCQRRACQKVLKEAMPGVV